MMQSSSHRLDVLLRKANASLDGVGDVLSRSDKLRSQADSLSSALDNRNGLNFARLRWTSALSRIRQSRLAFTASVLKRKARLRRRIFALHLLRAWRIVRWWVLLLVVLSGLIFLLVHYWSWIIELVRGFGARSPQASPPSDFIGPPADFIGPPAPPGRADL